MCFASQWNYNASDRCIPLLNGVLGMSNCMGCVTFKSFLRFELTYFSFCYGQNKFQKQDLPPCFYTSFFNINIDLLICTSTPSAFHTKLRRICDEKNASRSYSVEMLYCIRIIYLCVFWSIQSRVGHMWRTKQEMFFWGFNIKMFGRRSSRCWDMCAVED